MHLFQTGGHFLFGTAVYDINVLRTHTLCASCRIHGNVAAADNGNRLAVADGGIIFGQICLHQVDSCQIFICGIYADQSLAGDTHEGGQTCACADEYGIEAHIVDDFINGKHLADNHICHNFYAQSSQLINFLLHDCLRQTEFGNTVNQHAACLMEGLKHGDSIAQLCQIACTGKCGGAGADDCNPFAVGGRLFGHFIAVFHIPIGNEAFQTTDGNCLALHASDTFGFALAFLRTNTTADRRQRIGRGDDLISRHEVTLCNLCDKFGDAYINGTAAHAGLMLTVQASLCFFDCHFLGVAEGNLFKVFISYIRCLLGHLDFFQTHICHDTVPPYLISSFASLSIRQMCVSVSSASLAL